MLVLGELEVKRKCALVRSSGQTVPVSSAAVPHCYSVSHHYGQFSNRVGLGAVLVRGPSGLALPTGETLMQNQLESAQAQGCGLGPQPWTPVAPCRSFSVTLLKGLGVTFTSGELGGGERTLGV